jgi:Ca2+-binding RTX toxin-like protein
MTKIIIPGGDHTYAATQADTTYLLKAGSSIDTSDAMGIDGFYDTPGRTFEINGTISGANSGISAGTWNGLPENIHVLIGETGVIDTNITGVALGGVNSSVVNQGVIHTTDAQGHGIGSEGHDNLLDNQGNITSFIGISSIGDNNEVTNSGKIVAGYQGVLLNTMDGQHNSLLNTGTIKAGDPNNVHYSVYGGGGDEHVVNAGRMVGDVYLQGGEDTFISRGGTVTGLVYGGADDDTYVIDRSNITLVENAGEGLDRVRSSASYTLADNIEQATLTGKADIDLTGTQKGDLLYGNKGDNEILGGDGLDYITGNRGNDTLSGGGLAGNTDIGDVFVFHSHSGRDVITDFQDGMDHINIGSYEGIETFADLAIHIKKDGADTLITLLDGDSIRLLDTDHKSIGADDFQF